MLYLLMLINKKDRPKRMNFHTFGAVSRCIGYRPFSF